jgi:hypothetical protein
MVGGVLEGEILTHYVEATGFRCLTKTPLSSDQSLTDLGGCVPAYIVPSENDILRWVIGKIPQLALTNLCPHIAAPELQARHLS